MKPKHRPKPDSLTIYLDADAKVTAYLHSWNRLERLIALRKLLPMCAQPELSDYALGRAIEALTSEKLVEN